MTNKQKCAAALASFIKFEIFPKPSTKYEEILMSKTAIRDENGYYEFLLTHYVTFTGRMLRPTKQCIFQDISKVDELFDNVAKTKNFS